MVSSASPRRHEVLILGAGMSGLCMGMQLKAAGRHDFVLLEKSAGLGGTWWDNRYPGAHVDVPAPLYAFSFEPNPDWTRRFAAAPEIQAYMQRCAERHGLLPHLRLNTELREARFDEARSLWCLTTTDGTRWEAPFFVCSMGPLSRPRWPAIEGIETFRGERLHSARWDDAVPLAGRRVAVIGTGSTASQLVPPIAETAGRLHVFQRTANWVMPRIDRPYHRLDHWLAHLPPYNAATRWFWYRLLEWGRRGFDDGTFARKSVTKAARIHLHRQVADPALRAKLTPDYPYGCKRIIYSNDFYPALTRPNVELVTDPIERITERGIRTRDGVEREVDVLVCATGFQVEHSLGDLVVAGRGGKTLAEAWSEGPQAHRGITVAGFPNLFLMLGPNTATGHTSTLLYIEPGVRWVLRAMAEVQRRGGRTVEVRADAMGEYNRAIQSRLEGSVWSGCRSWYRAESGRIIAIWPGFTDEYRRALDHDRFESCAFA